MAQQRLEASQTRKREGRRAEKRNGQKKEDASHAKTYKIRKTPVFPILYGSGGLKNRFVCFFEWLQWSPHTQAADAMKCGVLSGSLAVIVLAGVVAVVAVVVMWA